MDRPIDIERACKLVRDVAGAIGVHEAGDMALTQATSLVLAHHESLQDRALKAEAEIDRLTAEVARMQGERDAERALRLALEQERSAWISNRVETLQNVNGHLRTELAGAQSAIDEQRAANAGMRGQLDQHADACKRAGERIPVIERERDAALVDLAALKAECERLKRENNDTESRLMRAQGARDSFRSQLSDGLRALHAEDDETVAEAGERVVVELDAAHARLKSVEERERETRSQLEALSSTVKKNARRFEYRFEAHGSFEDERKLLCELGADGWVLAGHRNHWGAADGKTLVFVRQALAGIANALATAPAKREEATDDHVDCDNDDCQKCHHIGALPAAPEPTPATPAEIPDWNRCDLCGVRPSAIGGYCADCDVIQHAIDTGDTGELAPLLVNRRKKNQHTNAADTKARGLELELAAERARGKTALALLKRALSETSNPALRIDIAAALANHPAPANGRDE